MRHRVAHRKLGRVTEHRIAMLRNQATALLRHEHIETTVPKAKELRPFVERLITHRQARRRRRRGERQAAERAPAGHARRARTARSSPSCSTRSRRASRSGRAATRACCGSAIRRGDSAEVAQVELVGSEYDPNAEGRDEGRPTPPKPKKGVGGRLRAAAERLRGKKDDDGKKSGKAHTKAEGGRKITTPRKAGGA